MSTHPRSPRFLAALGAFLWAGFAAAAQLAVVDTVQAPAWLTRGEQVLPLAPGMEVRSNDLITTGKDARAYVKLAEGSMVKLGAETRFVFYSKSQRPRRNFRGALDISKGAFRYTGSRLGKQQSREVSVRVGAATVGIRGTDIWGRASTSEDMVVLIEGKIDVSRSGETVALETPLTRYRAEKGGAIMPLLQLDPSALQVLARETEILPGDGAMRRQGRGKVYIGAAVDQQDAALAIYDRVRAAGFAARLQVAGQAGAYRYSVYLPGFASQAEAEVAAQRINAVLGAQPGSPR